MHGNNIQRKLVLMVGLPRAGKSTYAARNAEADNLVTICADDLRLELTGQVYYEPAEPLIWYTLEVMVRVLLRSGYNVLVDAANVTVAFRQRWVRLARALETEEWTSVDGEAYKPEIKVGAWVMAASSSVCIQRARATNFPVAVIEQMALAYEQPEEKEGLDFILKI